MIEFSGAESAFFVSRSLRGARPYQPSLSRRPRPAARKREKEEEEESKALGTAERAKAAFDRLFVRRLWAILRVLFARQPGQQQKGCTNRASLCAALLCVLVVVQTLTSSLTGRVIGDVYTAMSERSLALLGAVAWRAVLVTTASAVLDAAIKLVTQLLALAWRRALVAAMQEAYFADGVFYRLNALDDRVDNPDMRLTQDIDNFTATLATVVQQCASGPAVVVLYTVFCARQIAWYAPLLVFAFFLLGFAANRALSNPIAALVYVQERLEGDFRFVHAWVRSLAEVIELSGGRAREEQLAQGAFARLLRNKLRVVWWQGGLALTSNAFTYFGSLVNYAVVALAVFVSGAAHSISDVSADCYYCIMLVSGWSVFFNASKLLSDLAGFTARLGHMLEVSGEVAQSTRELAQRHRDQAQQCSGVWGDREHDDGGDDEGVCDENAIVARGLTTYTPDSRVLARNLCFVVRPGRSLVVTGPSGCGKSTLLKVIHGIWPFYDGVLRTPVFSPTLIQYLPQKPYICHHMTLSEQITYPLLHVRVARAELERLLALLDLQHLAQQNYVRTAREKEDTATAAVATTAAEAASVGLERGCDEEEGYDTIEEDEKEDRTKEWHATLSPGEQQRLCFLRVLFHRPQYAVLDEATSALDEAMEARCYSLLVQAGITLISVSHHESIRRFHQLELRFSKPEQETSGASWQLIPIASSPSPSAAATTTTTTND